MILSSLHIKILSQKDDEWTEEELDEITEEVEGVLNEIDFKSIVLNRMKSKNKERVVVVVG